MLCSSGYDNSFSKITLKGQTDQGFLWLIYFLELFQLYELKTEKSV
jgi:hypothetical protein